MTAEERARHMKAGTSPPPVGSIGRIIELRSDKPGQVEVLFDAPEGSPGSLRREACHVDSLQRNLPLSMEPGEVARQALFESIEEFVQGDSHSQGHRQASPSTCAAEAPGVAAAVPGVTAEVPDSTGGVPHGIAGRRPRPLIVHISNVLKWGSGAVPSERRAAFLEELEADMDLLEGPVVIIGSNVMKKRKPEHQLLRMAEDDLAVSFPNFIILEAPEALERDQQELTAAFNAKQIREVMRANRLACAEEGGEEEVEVPPIPTSCRLSTLAAEKLVGLARSIYLGRLPAGQAPLFVKHLLALPPHRHDACMPSLSLYLSFLLLPLFFLFLLLLPSSGAPPAAAPAAAAAAAGRAAEEAQKGTPPVTPPVPSPVPPPAPLLLAQPNLELLKKRVVEVELDQYEKELQAEVIPPHRVGVAFDQIGALDDAKAALKELVMLPLQRPELFARGNLAKPCKGVLLFGPPGTGKTMLAKAVATEAGASFINVSASSIASKWFGEAEKLTRSVFTLARKLAPCVVFVDEVDSLLGARGAASEHEATRKMRNEFMAAWDGLQSGERERVLVLAATNRPFDLDDAEDLADGFSHEELAQLTEGYSGSDLKNLCVSAAYRPIRDLLHLEEKERERARLLEVASASAEGASEVAPVTASDTAAAAPPQLRPITIDDFKQAMTQVGASVAQDAESVVALQRWNDQYGEGGSRKRRTFGFLHQ
eukprot:jgi/Mesen1/4168/ME000219S03294